MVSIYKIDWLSKCGREAEVYLSDGNFHLVCFSHPFNLGIGDIISFPLYAMNSRNIYSLNEDGSFSAERVSSDFEYRISARVVDKDSNLVKFGEFIIELDMPFPGDIKLGDFVSFLCDRIDLY